MDLYLLTCDVLLAGYLVSIDSYMNLQVSFFMVEIELNIVVHYLVILFTVSGYIALYPVILT